MERGVERNEAGKGGGDQDLKSSKAFVFRNLVPCYELMFFVVPVFLVGVNSSDPALPE